MSTVTIVGGGHGAGKTTFCLALAGQRGWTYLTNQVIRATHGAELDRATVHRMLRERATACFEQGESFVFEHVMSGTFAGHLLDLAHEHGFVAELVYLDVVDVAHAVARVSQRVAQGGHDVERDKLAARLGESRAQFWNDYRLRARRWVVFDTSGREPVEIASGSRSRVEVADPDRFDAFRLRAERTDARVMN